MTMIPALLITFREILEATLIIATVLGVLKKLGYTQSMKTVWLGAASATFASIIILITGSLFGLKVHELFEEHEALFEGVIMIISAFFMTWAVFFLHKTFSYHKLALLQKVKATMEKNEQKGIFLLVFTAVFREGMEIVLFLSTIFFSAEPLSIVSGFLVGTLLAVFLSYGIFTTTIRLPVYQTFRVTSILLILFAAGMLAHGYHEMTEARLLPEFVNLPTLTLFFLPAKTTIAGSLIRGIFGVSRTMHSLELLVWSAYTFIMWQIVIVRKSPKEQ